MIWLDTARIIAIAAVVFLHVTAAVLLSYEVDSYTWMAANIYNSAVRWCVPVFVMVSGALLLDPTKASENPVIFYHKRLSRVLVPLLFWSFFYLAWTWHKDAAQGREVSLNELAIKLVKGEPYYHMWFLYMILGLYLFTPFLRKLVAHCTTLELWLLVILLFAIAAFNAMFPVTGTSLKPFTTMFLSYLPYFILGHLIRMSQQQPERLWPVLIFALTVAMAAAGTFILAQQSVSGLNLYFYGNLSISVIPMSIAMMYLLKAYERPIVTVPATKTLAMLSLGVYLIHPVIIELLALLGYGVHRFHPIIWMPVFTAIILLLSFTLSWFIKQIPALRRVI